MIRLKVDSIAEAENETVLKCLDEDGNTVWMNPFKNGTVKYKDKHSLIGNSFKADNSRRYQMRDGNWMFLPDYFTPLGRV